MKNTKIEKPKIRVLLEAQKLMDVHHDGVFRYVHSLVKYMQFLKKNRNAYPHIEIDLLINGQVRPLYTEVNAFKVVDKGIAKVFKEKMWSLYQHFPKKLQGLSVRFVNLYFAIKSSFYLWVNRKSFEEYDCLHFTLPQNYYVFKYVKNSNFIATVHDLTHEIFPQYHLKRNVKNADRGFQFIKERNVSIIAVSQATKEDLKKFNYLDNNRVQVIYESADREVFNKIYDKNRVSDCLEVHGLLGKNYIFSLATLEPRKNLKKTLEAFVLYKTEHPESDLLFALGGKQGWKEKLGYQEREDIIHLGYIAEADLPMLYNGASFFIYCSHYEGFGLPLLEAMRCGTPVIYGNNSSMKEIVGTCGIGVDSNDVMEISQAIHELSGKPSLRTSLSQAGYQKALEYSWTKAARETWAFYEQIANQKRDDGI